jgi:glycosyltransferase involved in cell wall biosynthesis
MSTPEISVVVASHDRPLRLRWLLNALEDQTLPRDRWELIVAHDSVGPETDELLTSHPLAREGTLRHVSLPPSSAPPGANRNAALKLARAPLIAFTDDDCRPPSDWLARALHAARRNPGAIVQGRTAKDPAELNILQAPHTHSQIISPPSPWAECCNIVYPKELIERAGGFRVETYTGEDTDLAMRCRALGAKYVGDPSVLTYHAIGEVPFLRLVKGLWRWQDLPVLIKRHPEMRQAFPLWIFWKRSHAWLPSFFAGLFLGHRRGLQWTVLCVPFLAHTMPAHGSDPRGRYRNLIETPSKLAVAIAEFVVLTIGSIRHRSLLL